MPSIRRKPTRAVRIGSIQVGGGAPIAVQSMAATKTQDIEATTRQVTLIHAAGADIIRIACDSKTDVAALAELRARVTETIQPNLSVDLHENFLLAEVVAPHVDKIRYIPGHQWHHEREKSIPDQVAYIAGIAEQHDVALRVGVN